MPIPFRDAEDIEALGAAAYLTIEPADNRGCLLGALFLVTGRGEPLEFVYNRVETPHTFLWRESDLRRHAERRLVASLLEVCVRAPRLLLCRVDQVGPDLFIQDIQLSIPVARLEPSAGPGNRRVDQVTGEVLEDPYQVVWLPASPVAGSPERELFERLDGHGLLTEPFDRATVGLREVFGNLERVLP